MFQQFNYLIADLKRWQCASIKEFFYVVFELGVWATVLYRIGRALYVIDIPVIKVLLRFAGFLLSKFSEIFLGIALPPGANIGPGLYIGHTGAIRIHHDAVIGKNFSLGTGVIVGTRGGGKQGVAQIGDDVYAGVGAKILGPVNIGSGAKIGANAVVLSDVPEGATVAGIPARIMEKN